MNKRYLDEIKKITNWLNKDMGGRKRLYPESVGDIKDSLSDNLVESGRQSIWQMRSVAFYYANEASIASHFGAGEASQHWACYSDFGYWEDRIHEAGYYSFYSRYYQKSTIERAIAPRSTDPRSVGMRWSALLFFWVAYNEEFKVKRSLRGILNTQETGAFGVWGKRPVHGLLLKLARMIIDDEPAEANLQLIEPQTLGPYEAIFRNWHNTERLRQALFDALEYHESRSHDDKDFDKGDFSECPAVLLPLEFMAIRAIRDKAELETPVPDHWMLQTPLYLNLPKSLPPCEDDLLANILKEVGKYLPIHLDDLSLHYPSPLALHKRYATSDPPPPLPNNFGAEEESERLGLFRKGYSLIITMRFVRGETLATNWSRFLEAIENWRKLRGRNGSRLTILFQSEPAVHPDLYHEYTRRIQSNPALEDWIETLAEYTLRFQLLDGSNCRDLVWLKQPDGSNLFSERRYSTPA
jgi:hypothetical protein